MKKSNQESLANYNITRSFCYLREDINPVPAKKLFSQNQVRKFADQNNVPVEKVFGFIRPDTGTVAIYHE